MYSFEDIQEYIFQYQPTGIIIDTNILLLLLIGSYDRGMIENCKTTNRFVVGDFDNLTKILSYFGARTKIITPHILAEVSNMLEQGFTSGSEKFYTYFSSVIDFLKSTEEKYCPKDAFMNMELKVLADLGVTDLGMVEIVGKSDKKLAILTDDLELTQYSIQSNIPVIKLGYFRNLLPVGSR